MKKNSRIFLVACIFLFLCFFTQMKLVQGYNYDPSVNVGDELIWKSRTSHNNGSIDEQYSKHLITSIIDIDGISTEVKVNSSSSADNIDYHHQEENTTYGVLENYDEYPIFILSRLYHYITPGTKIGDYIGYFLQPTPYWDVPIDSIERGYGIQFTQDTGDETTLVFNRDGILEKYGFFNASINENYEYNLYSINGEIYTPKRIPGYSVWMLSSFCLVIIGLIIVFNRKSPTRKELILRK